MSMTKRIQIPVNEPLLAIVKAAALRAGVPMAEWARSVLFREARRSLGEENRSPEEALKHLFSTNAPIADVETLIEESIRGRLR